MPTPPYSRDRSIKIPLGTLLPYFIEDSDHAYVIMPGFYSRRIREQRDSRIQRTASDVLDLIEKIIALVPEIPQPS